MSKRMTLLLVLALQACSAFGIDDDESSRLRVHLGGAGTRGTPSGDPVRINNSPFDPRGMAGVEIEITGIGGLIPTLTLTGADFQKSPSREWETRIPADSHVSFVVRLRDDSGQLVAEEISGSFTANIPDATWRLQLRREPFVGADIQNPICPDPYWRCVQVWLLDIREDARNYPSELLWIVLYRNYACAHGSCM